MSELPAIESDEALEKRSEEAQTTLSRLRARLDALMGTLGGGGMAVLRAAQTADLARLGRPGLVAMEPPALDPGEAAAYDAVSTSALFDAEWYRASGADTRETGLDPALHYVRFGAQEGRAPGPAFDGAAYLAAHPDVAAAGLNPLHHYETAGKAEGRRLAPSRRLANAFMVSDQPLRIVAALSSFEEYKAFVDICPEAFAAKTEEVVKEHARRYGTATRLLGAVPPERTEILGDDMREHLISGGISSRVRAVSEIIFEAIDDLHLTEQTARIYGHEAITPFAQMMRARFPRFLGTEYAPSPAEQERIFPIMHNDVCASRFADGAFDIAFSCDVLEHVYDRDRLLGEAARTLRPDGRFIATFPFDHDTATGWLFAEVVDGGIRHHLETPIYHGNPMDEGGSLVFEIVGWDIIGRAIAAGFSHAEMRLVCDQRQGVIGSAMGRVTQPRGIFVLVCRK